MPTIKPFPSAGQRLAAALISYKLGYPSVDAVLDKWGEVLNGYWWEQKAQELLDDAATLIAVAGSKPDHPQNIQ